MEKIKILVCAHKVGSIYQDSMYMPIQGGKAISNIDLGIQGDDTGDNISAKNKRYCESTVLYWGWKNLNNVEYLGLAHYRRRFESKMNIDNIDKLMKDKDIITVKPGRLNCPVIELLRKLICLEDLCIFIDTLLEIYPDYRKTIIDYYYSSNRLIPFHMFVTQKKEFDKYCEFLFKILFRVEERIRPANYTRLNRSLAYMGEFLLGLYCIHNNLRIHYLEMEGEGQDTRSPIIQSLAHIKNNLQFSLYRTPHDIPSYPGVISGLKEDNIYLQYIEKTK